MSARPGFEPAPVAPPAVDAGDAALVAAVRDGDVAAFESMFRTHYSGLVRFATSLTHSRTEGEELVQDVLARVWAGRAAWEVRDGVAVYLYGAVRNRAFVASRHARVVDRWRETAAIEQTQDAPPTSDEIETRELTEVLREAIAALPDRCRQTYVLSREGGLSYAEIATTMGTSVRTVNAQMSRAMAALRRAVERWR